MVQVLTLMQPAFLGPLYCDQAKAGNTPTVWEETIQQSVLCTLWRGGFGCVGELMEFVVSVP